MYIKSMVLEGFKSYAQRTEIYGFDPEFNAITGLNGSGKSNILDGICFLLGISNLSQVRALNLNELVYKNGQGGVNKATVSITFDNSDKEQSPLGYADFPEFTITRQIAIGNRNKYMINGFIANNQRVQDLFRSVQLNVNNPHFLIMQGRITKVLNMKPAEILSMIEEATGTRLYENKKEANSRLLCKKDAKFNEIDNTITAELNPSLLKLKEDQAAYLEFQKINRELEHLHKFYIAFKYYGLEKMLTTSMSKLQELKHSSEATKDEIAQQTDEMQKLKSKVDELERKKDKEAGGKLQKLTEDLEAARLEEARVSSLLATLRDSLNVDQARLSHLQAQIRNDDVSIVEKNKRVNELETRLLELEVGVRKDKAAHTDAIEQLQAVKVGMSAAEGGRKQSTVQEQLRNANMEISNAETQAKDTTLKLKHSRGELKKQQALVKREDSSYKRDEASIERLNCEVGKLQDELAHLDYSEQGEKDLVDEHRSTEASLHQLSSRVQSLKARLHQMDFEYSTPERGFDRTSVKGLVANLVRLNDPSTAVALEVIAGGKLFQVVVDTEQTAKKILEKGDLRRRVTFIPLNKISTSTIHPSVVQRAKQLVGDNNVSTALSLVSYDSDLEAAMKYVFGSSFVCANMAAARKVTFNDSIKKKSVTLDGNSFDPAGLASGGANQRADGILVNIGCLRNSQHELNTCQDRLKNINSRLMKVQAVSAQWRRMSDRLDISKNELRMLREKVRNSAYGQQLEEIRVLQDDIKEMEALLETSKQAREESAGRVAELEGQLRDREGHRKREEGRVETEMAQCKRKVDASVALMEAAQQECSMLQLEVRDLGKEHEETCEQITSLKETIRSGAKEIVQVDVSLHTCHEDVSRWQGLVTEQRELMLVCTRELELNNQQLHSIVDSLHEKKIKVDDLEHQTIETNKQAKEDSKKLERMTQKEGWIEEEKASFNVANGTYDFRTNDTHQIEVKIKKLEEVKSNLSKNVNTRAMSMLMKAEEQHKDLMFRRPTVIKDRFTIDLLIHALDDKKQRTLKKAVKQVNKDFGSIFSTLLPGASARLEAIMEGDALTGVEFKVGFGGVWKDSLTELSGGQRSLIALSLILSLLLFKPAPLYILDEVDAALDLSHTQNMGQMLKAHFKHTQFIIVSLKEGMFTNANVLFRTNFSEGVSSVCRITQKHHSSKTKNKNKQNGRVENKSD